MAKDQATYKELRKSMNRIMWAARIASASIYPIIFLLNAQKNIEQNKTLNLIAEIIATIFAVVYYFIVAHIIIIQFMTVASFMVPIILIDAFTTIIAKGIRKQQYFYHYWHQKLSAPLSDYYFLKLQMGVDRSVRHNRKNFKYGERVFNN